MRASPTLHGRRVAAVTAATRRERFARALCMAATGGAFALLFLVIATDWRL